MKVLISVGYTQEIWSIIRTIALRTITGNSLKDFEQRFHSKIWYMVNEMPEL